MKRSIVLLTALLSLPTLLRAQQFLLEDANAGERGITWQGDGFVLPGHDNTFWSFGVRFSNEFPMEQRIVMSKFNYSGDVLLRRGLSGKFVQNVVQLKDGDFILSIDGPRIVRCDSTGQIKWGMKWPDTTDMFGVSVVIHIMVLSGDSTLFMLRRGGADLSLYKLTTNGKVLGGRKLKVGKARFERMVSTADGGLLILASELDIKGPTKSVVLIKTNKSGEMVWKRHYSVPLLYNLNDIAVRNNDNILVYGSNFTQVSNAMLMEFDPLGNLLHSRAYTTPGIIRHARFAVTATDTYMFFTSPDGDGWHTAVIRVDTSGSVVSAFDYGETDRIKYAMNIVATSEGFVASAVDSTFPYFIIERGEECSAYRREFTSTVTTFEATETEIAVTEEPLEWSLVPTRILPLSVDLLFRRYLCRPSSVDDLSVIGERRSEERVLCRRGEDVALPLQFNAQIDRVLFYDLLGQLQAELPGDNLSISSEGKCHLKLPPGVLGYTQVVVEGGSERSSFSLLVE